MYSYSPFQDDWDEEVSLGGASGDGLERASACAFSLYHENIQKAYVCLGQTQTVAYMKDLWEFNPQTETWSQKANYTGSARRQAVCFTAANKAYVGTGEGLTGLKKDFYAYDPESNAWTQVADFAGTARRDAVAFELNGYGFVGTGDDGILKNDIWMYIKLGFVLILAIYHLITHKIYRQLQKDDVTWNSMKLRLWNEVATVLLVVIVFLVVYQRLNFYKGVIAFFAMVILLMLATKLYKKMREKNDKKLK